MLWEQCSTVMCSTATLFSRTSILSQLDFTQASFFCDERTGKPGIVQLVEQIDYGLDVPGVEFWQVREISLFFQISRLAVGPTQTLIQCVEGYFPRGKTSGASHHSSTSSVDTNNNSNYNLLPPCFHGVASSKFNLFYFTFQILLTKTIL